MASRKYSPHARLSAGLARWQRDRGRRLVDDAFKVVQEACQHGGPTEIHSEILPMAAVPTLVDLSKDAELVVAARDSMSYEQFIIAMREVLGIDW